MSELMIVKKALESRRLPCRLSESELSEIVKQCAGAIGEAETALQHFSKLDTAAKDYKKENLIPKNGRVADLSTIIRSGTEFRNVDCVSIFDYDKQMVIVKRTDTDAVVDARDMTSTEQRLELFDEETHSDIEGLRKDVATFFSRRGDRPAEP